MKKLLLSISAILTLLFLFGCATEADAQDGVVENVSANLSAQGEAPRANLSPEAEDNRTELEAYSGQFFLFGYLPGMKIEAEDKNNSQGQPYGSVQVSGERGNVLLFWKTYVPENASIESTLAGRFLYAFERDGDPLEMLDNATNKSAVVPHDLVVVEKGGKLSKKSMAEMSFEKEEGGAHFYCYALEYYEPELDVMASVRIFSETPEDAALLRNAFFETFMFSNWQQIMGSN